MLDSGLCMECLGSQFYDAPTQQCKTCHESCRSCTGTGQYSCATCAFPLHLDRLNNQCVPCCPTDALPEDQSCCHCDKNSGKLIADAELVAMWVSWCVFCGFSNKCAVFAMMLCLQIGGCINSSPAGKRRIAVGAEQQLNEDLAAALGLVHDGSERAGWFAKVASPFTTITALTVAACLLVVTIFVIIFAVLQVTI